jgi:iron complex outermembrane receptor protein
VKPRLLAVLAPFALAGAALAQTDVDDLTALSLEELINTPVTLVSRKAEPRTRVPAAIDVVTPDDILGTGATTLVEAIRNVPGVHVARLSSSQWAVGIRGFTSLLNRSQLVLIDGRSVYSPLFAGTYWDVQDTLLEDVERIEIVRGPGGTLWGANAVNGILNVVTKPAGETQGGFVTAGAGNVHRAFARARYGGRIGDDAHYRVYGKFFERESGFVPTGDAFDESRMTQGGFRMDWNRNDRDQVTLQGDVYSARHGQRVRFASYAPPFIRVVAEDATMSGANVLGRWTRSFPNAARLEVQTYLDRTERNEPTFGEKRDTADIDLQYQFAPNGRHELLAGAGYRISRGRTGGIETVLIDPADLTEHLASAFVQDEISVIPGRFAVTVGTKVEHNDFSGFEVQPGIRAAWFAGADTTVWAAATRAVRTPSRFDRDLQLTLPFDAARPIFLRAIGNDDFDSERVDAFEAGYRRRLTERVHADLAVFYNRYPNLFSLEQGTPFLENGTRAIAPFRIDNNLMGRTTGGELTVDSALTDRWSLKAAYSYLQMDLRTRPGSTDISSAAAEDHSPRHMVQIQSSLVLTSDVGLHARLRWVDDLPSQSIDSLTTLDARLIWQTTPHLSFAVTGQNLLDPRHGEFGATNVGFAEIERSVFGEVTWRW